MKEYIEAIIEKIEINPVDIICDSSGGTGEDTPLPFDDDEVLESFYMDKFYGK